MWHADGTDWQKWYPAIRAELLKHPDRQTLKNGAETFWEDRTIGSHFGTALALIVLQIPHEKLPSLRYAENRREQHVRPTQAMARYRPVGLVRAVAIRCSSQVASAGLMLGSGLCGSRRCGLIPVAPDRCRR